MTFTMSATLLAVVALVAGIAGFIAPRFLGIMVAAGLCLFAVVQLFPEVTTLDLGETLSAIDLDDFGINDTNSAGERG